MKIISRILITIGVLCILTAASKDDMLGYLYPFEELVKTCLIGVGCIGLGGMLTRCER
jgi:hypothetical protein